MKKLAPILFTLIMAGSALIIWLEAMAKNVR